MTAYTPGDAAARDVSMRTIRACGCVDLSSFPNAMRGSTRSSAYLVSPVTFAHASTFGSGCPMSVNGCLLIGLLSGARRCGCAFGRGPTHAECRQLHGVEDLRVSRAATQIAGQRLLYLLAGGRRQVVEQRLRGQEDAGRTVAALRGSELRESLLQ